MPPSTLNKKREAGPVAEQPATSNQRPATSNRSSRLIGWQGLAVQTPDGWDLTGFSGGDANGYVRIDDGDECALELKWDTLPAKEKKAPPVDVRRESYFRTLRLTAKKRKITLDLKATDAPRGLLRDDRAVAGFTWIGDRKAIGAVWYCETCRRIVIAQVMGERSGRGGLSGIADRILASLRCHGDDAAYRTWALYDLITEVPVEYKLSGQQLMNVYLRLEFTARKTAKLCVEQWAVANVARRDAYLDAWLQKNSKGPLTEARYDSAEAEPVNGHPSLSLAGGLEAGLPMFNAARDALQLRRPATRFSARAWECDPTNKIYAITAMRPANAPDVVGEIAARTRCHPHGKDEG